MYLNKPQPFKITNVNQHFSCLNQNTCTDVFITKIYGEMKKKNREWIKHAEI